LQCGVAAKDRQADIPFGAKLLDDWCMIALTKSSLTRECAKNQAIFMIQIMFCAKLARYV
jgi:hypothetical protein